MGTNDGDDGGGPHVGLKEREGGRERERGNEGDKEDGKGKLAQK